MTSLTGGPYAIRRAFTDLYCQALATFLSPGLEDSAPSFGLHPSPKAVHPLAPTHFGLPRSFRHSNTSPIRITTRNYTLFPGYLQIPTKARNLHLPGKAPDQGRDASGAYDLQIV